MRLHCICVKLNPIIIYYTTITFNIPNKLHYSELPSLPVASSNRNSYKKSVGGSYLGLCIPLDYDRMYKVSIGMGYAVWKLYDMEYMI